MSHALVEMRELPTQMQAFASALHNWHVDTQTLLPPRQASAVFAFLHEQIARAVQSGTVSADFVEVKTDFGAVVVQQAFLETAQQTVQMARPLVVQSGLRVPTEVEWSGKCAELSELGVLSLLTQYHVNFNKERGRHIGRLLAAYKYLPQAVQSELVSMVPKVSLGGLIDTFVAILSPFDERGEFAWKQLGLSSADFEQIRPWHKMWECGVVMGSAVYQSGPRSHDYLIFAMLKAISEGISLREQMLENTTKHEGRGHGFVDALLDLYLGNTPSYTTEYIAGALGQDNRVTQAITLEEAAAFFNGAYPTDEIPQYIMSYRVGPVLLSKICTFLAEKHRRSIEATWARIVAALIQTASEISKNKHVTTVDDRYKLHFKQTCQLLEISEHDLQHIVQLKVALP